MKRFGVHVSIVHIPSACSDDNDVATVHMAVERLEQHRPVDRAILSVKDCSRPT